MKNILLLFFLLLQTHWGFAQNTSTKIPVSVGYFSFLGFQPGAKIGTHFDLKNWETETEKSTKQKSLFVSPQLAFYTNPNIQTSYIANVDIGYRRVRSHNQKYNAWSLGFGYLNESRISEWRVSLGDGEKEKVRENVSWFLPSLNYEFGKAINEKITWYSKFSYALKVAASRESSSLIFMELGLKFNLF